MEEEKKINDELEKMSEEELNHVAGGTHEQVAGDNVFLKAFGYTHYDKQPGYVINLLRASDLAQQGWSEAGICSVQQFAWSQNEYYLDGKQISRKEAFAHVLKLHGYSDEAIANFKYDSYEGNF